MGKDSSSHPSQFPFLCQSTELIFLSHRSGSASLKNLFYKEQRALSTRYRLELIFLLDWIAFTFVFSFPDQIIMK